MRVAPLQMGAPVPFKRLAAPSLGKMLQPEASSTAYLQVPYLKAGHVQWRGVELPEELPVMWASAADVQELTPKPGDLLICEGGEVGRAALTPNGLPDNTIIQNSLHLVRESDQACPRYLKYALEHIAASGWIDLVCNKATIAHLTVDKLRELPIPYWKKAGQERIANFLDEQTARIDALIAEKERLRERLKELWMATVVSRIWGESADVLTAHDTVAIRHLLAGCSNGTTAEQVDESASTIAVTRIETISTGVINRERVGYVELSAELERFKLIPGDILFSHINSLAMIGNCAIYSGGPPLYVGMNLLRLRPRVGVCPEWLELVIKTTVFRQQVEASAKPAINQASISQSSLLAIKVPDTSVEKQHTLAVELAAKRKAVDELQVHVEQHLAALRAYRSSLISAAVTGQLDLSTFKAAA